MDDLIVGYALNALDPADRAAVEAHLADSPAAAAKLARVRQVLRPLAADRGGYDPPPGLAAGTVARVMERAAHPFPDRRPVPASLRPPVADDLVFPFWRRADVLVAATVAFLASGLLLAGVGKLRRDQEVAACQNRLREVHQALAGYGDTHAGRFPEVGTPGVPVAGAFAAELERAGQLPPGVDLTCPAHPAPENVVGYAYALGYVGPTGRLTGLRQTGDRDGAADWVPVAADLPADPAPAHPRGQNVLYVGGAVRFSTTAAAGVDGDDIYRNDAGVVRAGLHRFDAALGRPTDAP